MTKAKMNSVLTRVRESITRREYREALRLLDDFQPSQVEGEDARAEFSMLRGECLTHLGECARAVEVVEPVARRLRSGSDHAAYAAASLVLATAHYYQNDFHSANENGMIALYSFRRSGDPIGEIRSLNCLGNIAYSRGDYQRRIEHLMEARTLAEESGAARWVAVIGYNLAGTYVKTGRLAQARELLVDLPSSFHVLEDGLNALRCELTRSMLAILSRDFSSAHRMLNSIEAELLDSGLKFELGIYHEYLGLLELSRGNAGRAVKCLAEAVAVANSIGEDDSLLGQSRRLLAEVRLAEGDPKAALEEAERALGSITKVGERFEDGAVHRVIGEAHTKLGNAEEARAAFRHAVDILQMIGARLEWARACLSAGRCHLFEDRERLGYLVEADRLFAEIGVEYWIGETKTTLGEILHREAPQTGGTPPVPSGCNSPTIIAEDPKSRAILSMADRVAVSDIAVLITGETGAGKDLMARRIHDQSRRSLRPFVTIDLSTIPETLWESELFGHCKGAFTGAQEKRGLLASADGGTVFLNEVGNFPPSLQTKLLEFLESRRIRRLGGTESTTLDVRLIAATNADLSAAVAAGQFRSDLYFRLSPATLHLPPLRERREDILPLIRHILTEFGMSESRLASLASQDWVAVARKQEWPGNIRQLRNFLWNLTAISGSANASDLFEWANQLIGHVDNGNLTGPSPSVAPSELLRLLDQHDWNRRAVARELGVSDSTVRNWVKRHGIERPGGD